MKKIILVVCAVVMLCATDCSKKNRDGDRPLVGDPVTPPVTDEPALSDIFSYKLGTTIPVSKVQQIKVDQSGQSVLDDYDGDGVPNCNETTTNPFVAEYPKIVTRIAPPITMEIRVDSNIESANHSETVEDSGVTSTITNSMEDRQYTSLNQKTTPYVSKESQATSDNSSESWGQSDEHSIGGSVSVGGSFMGTGGSSSVSYNQSDKTSRNEAWSKGMSQSTSSEKMEFVDKDYVDNLNKSGTAFTDESVEKITKNARKSKVLSQTDKIGPDAGYVRAAFFIKNETIDIPAHITNVKCTLTFRTPAGKFLPVKTFLLRNEDYTAFDQDVYGDEELGPYAIELSDLNTNEVTKALQNGYIPQIHVVSYDLSRVKDSNYNPGVDNLKIVEETAKGRTAFITISGSSSRDKYRVCAFDVDAQGNVSPGISLKKALFNIFNYRVGRGESWDIDYNRNGLTVNDSGLKWKADTVDPYDYTYLGNTTGNSWRNFETYVKSYTDENNKLHHIETIKRIGPLQKYNPFDKQDNPNYNPNELLSDSEIRKMKYWYVLHNGKYYEGDLNDPIWAGDRYEIICVDVDDYNKHYASFNYTPMQTEGEVYVSSRWNSFSNVGEFARAKYFGKLYKEDKIILEINLKDTQYLFNPDQKINPWVNATSWNSSSLPYLFDSNTTLKTGKPSEFSFCAYSGTGSIAVDIADSENANNYDIILSKESSGKYSWYATFNIKTPKLKANGNTFNINRCVVPVSESNPGQISTQGLPNGRYKVEVKAWGSLYGVDVPLLSAGNSIIDVIPAENRVPEAYNATASGFTKGFGLSIGSGSNTEYFKVRYVGPCNTGCTPVTTEEIASAGYNSYTVTMPTDAGSISMVQRGEPGVYKVYIFPVNGYNLNSYDVAPYNNNPYIVTVFFDKYESQKSLKAQSWSAPSMIEAINLEVNFNDGPSWYQENNGWYWLKFSELDTRQGKFIDCRNTYYVDYKNQKFYITFAPPDGTGYSLWNVFTGGRDFVDLYIRTSAIPQYRDRFWPRTGSGSVTFTDQPRGFLPSWLGIYNDITDATGFETYVPAGRWNGLTLCSTNKADYFFSPYEYRQLGVTARLSADQMTLANGDVVVQPTFTANVYDDRTINLVGVSSSSCISFNVYYRQVVNDADAQSTIRENPMLWPKANGLPNEPDIVGSSGDETITGLKPNIGYVVAVIGTSSAGHLSPSAYYMNPSDTSKVGILTPIDKSKPVAPQNVSLSLLNDGSSIQVSNIYVSNATRYLVEWKEHLATTWNNNTYVTAVPGTPVSCITTGTTRWQTYYIRVTAFNDKAPDSLKQGPSSSIYQIRTDNYYVPILANVYVGPSSCDGDGRNGYTLTDMMLSFNKADLWSGVHRYSVTGYFQHKRVELIYVDGVYTDYNIITEQIPFSETGIPVIDSNNIILGNITNQYGSSGLDMDARCFAELEIFFTIEVENGSGDKFPQSYYSRLPYRWGSNGWYSWPDNIATSLPVVIHP